MRAQSFVVYSLLISLAAVLMLSLTAFGTPEAKISLRVVDCEGYPVSNAKVRSGLQTGDGLNDYKKVEGVTDYDGRFSILGPVKGILHFGVMKSGYYRSVNDILFSGTNVLHGRWMPYGTTRTVILKPKRRVGTLTVLPRRACTGEWTIPCKDKWLGFDLKAFDWVQPYGCGESDDMQILFRSTVRDRWHDFRHEMHVCFTNHPYAGAYVVRQKTDSRLKWPYEADTNAEFRTSFNFYSEKKPGGLEKQNFIGTDSCLVFRVRIQKNDDGSIKSSHYGMILGEWRTYAGKTMRFADGCFNQNSCDPCIEDSLYLRQKIVWDEAQD